MLNGKPLICVSADLATTADEREWLVNQNWTYPEAVRRGGGLPVIAPGVCAEELAQLCDALLLTGGADVDPALYGEEKLNDSVSFNPKRDQYELELFREFSRLGKPILGVCRGCQLINVALGGTLYQDLPTQLNTVHRLDTGRHGVHAEAGSILHGLFGAAFQTNSTHHQSVKDPAPGLWVTARSEEGVVEAFEHREKPIFATQFHPERLTGGFWDDRTPDFVSFFAYFIDLVKKSNQ